MKLSSSTGRSISVYLNQKAAKMKLPLSGTFELSPVCNFSCKMCYVRKTQKEVRESARSILKLNDWLEIAREARDAGMLYLLLTGGEPLLWPNFWELYEALVDMGFLVSINTNGALIDEEVISRFCKKPPRKINITLYGAGNETYQRLCGVDGVFEKIDKAIKCLLDNHIAVKLNCSLTPENAGDLDWIIDYAKKMATHLQVATYMFPPVRRDPAKIGENERFTPEESARYMLDYYEKFRGTEVYYNYLRDVVSGCTNPPGLEEGCVDPIDGKIRCRAGRSSFWVTWDGWMTPCGMMPEPKVDLKERKFAECWKMIVELSDEICLSGICSKCPNNKICHPCAAMAYAETGKTSGIPTYMCEYSKELRKNAVEILRINNR